MPRSPIVFALALVFAAAAPATALDLTGTWVGKFTCKVYDGTLATFKVTDDTMAIPQVGDTFAVDSANQFSGVAVPDSRSPDKKGEAKMANCTTDNDPTNGGDEIARLKAKVDRAKGKGKLKGVSVFTDPGAFGACKWSYKLVDPSDPGATGCTPP